MDNGGIVIDLGTSRWCTIVLIRCCTSGWVVHIYSKKDNSSVQSIFSGPRNPTVYIYLPVFCCACFFIIIVLANTILCFLSVDNFLSSNSLYFLWCCVWQRFVRDRKRRALVATSMAVTIDLTQGEFTEFSGSNEEDTNYAKTFWQSVHLQPPVESRLVSSDIKQRLRIAPSGSQSKKILPLL